MVLQEESGLFTGDNTNRYPIIQKITKDVIAGEWDAVESALREYSHPKLVLCYVLIPSRLEKLLYLIYKQEYLEFISRNENQKGLHFLFKYIKPLESVCESLHPGEFKELCYLLSLKVPLSPSLRPPERS